MGWYFKVLSTFSFSGQARRKEYWYWVLFNLIIVVILAVVSDAFHLTVPLSGSESQATVGYSDVTYIRVPVLIYLLLTIIQQLGVGVRRLHDRNWSGWAILFALIPLLGVIFLLVRFVQRGTPGENRFGPDPLAES